MVSFWVMQSYWSTTQLDLLDNHRYDNILNSTMDYRMYDQFVATMVYIVTTSVVEINTWIECLHRHCMKYNPETSDEGFIPLNGTPTSSL